MMATVWSIGLEGIDGYSLSCECDLSGGLPAFEIVGLPDTAVKEARERVRAAIRNCGFEFPMRRITINLAPADTKKEGPLYDLPILLAILKASGQLDGDFQNCAFLGEVSLDGTLRRVSGVLPAAIAAGKAGFKKLIVPSDNAGEGALAKSISVYGAKNIREVASWMRGDSGIAEAEVPTWPRYDRYDEDFADVKGQETAKRALEVAAAGGHNVLMIGPPGSGKSMLAKRLPSILPSMTHEEALETTKIYSVAGMTTYEQPLICARPFRSPHHTASDVSLVGGGIDIHPGEVSLAHNGVLFLDEMPEFTARSLNTLRQPLEDGEVTITRSAGTYTYPCDFMLVGAMNPCRCGWNGYDNDRCTCSPASVKGYRARVSGPLLDRIDIFVELPAVTYSEISDERRGEKSEVIRARVDAARKLQSERYAKQGIYSNAQLPGELVQLYCGLGENEQALLRRAYERFGFTARTYTRILKVSRTIADLAGSENVTCRHLSEAILFRNIQKVD